MKPRRAYLSGALTGVSDPAGARRLYEALAVAALDAGFVCHLPHTVTDPVEHADLSARAVFARDIEEINACEVVVAWLGTPSLGVGAEIALASAAGKHVVGVRPRDAAVSRFVLGFLDESGGVVVTVGDEGLGPVTSALRALGAA